jgi:hypothetical protein
MALTELQKAQVRMWLGYERGFEMNPQLESKFGDLTASEEALISAVLVRLDASDDAQDDLVTDGVHGVKQVDEIVLRDTDLSEGYTAAQSRQVSRLESILGVTRRFDVASKAGAGGTGGMLRMG